MSILAVRLISRDFDKLNKVAGGNDQVTLLVQAYPSSHSRIIHKITKEPC